MFSSNIVSNIPSLKELSRYVTPKYAKYWKEIAKHLKVDTFYRHRYVSERNSPFQKFDGGNIFNVRPAQCLRAYYVTSDEGQSNEDCCNEMFAMWLSKDSTASWKKLFAAIELIEASQSTWLKLKNYLY